MKKVILMVVLMLAMAGTSFANDFDRFGREVSLNPDSYSCIVAQTIDDGDEYDLITLKCIKGSAKRIISPSNIIVNNRACMIAYTSNKSETYDFVGMGCSEGTMNFINVNDIIDIGYNNIQQNKLNI